MKRPALRNQSEGGPLHMEINNRKRACRRISSPDPIRASTCTACRTRWTRTCTRSHAGHKNIDQLLLTFLAHLGGEFFDMLDQPSRTLPELVGLVHVHPALVLVHIERVCEFMGKTISVIRIHPGAGEHGHENVEDVLAIGDGKGCSTCTRGRTPTGARCSSARR